MFSADGSKLSFMSQTPHDQLIVGLSPLNEALHRSTEQLPSMTNTTQTGKTPFAIVELFAHILCRLSSQDLAKCAQVSHHWRDTLRSPSTPALRRALFLEPEDIHTVLEWDMTIGDSTSHSTTSSEHRKKPTRQPKLSHDALRAPGGIIVASQHCVFELNAAVDNFPGAMCFGMVLTTLDEARTYRLDECLVTQPPCRLLELHYTIGNPAYDVGSIQAMPLTQKSYMLETVNSDGVSVGDVAKALEAAS